MRARLVLGEIFSRHAEGENLDFERTVARRKSLARQRIDFGDLLVFHGVAPGRRTRAMHHQMAARAPMDAIELVGKAQVEGEVVIRIGIHQPRRDRIEPFGRLPVAFVEFGPEFARPGADLVGFEQPIASRGGLLPDLERAFFLVDAHHHRGLGRRPHGGELGFCRARKGNHVPPVALERRTRRERDREQQRANQTEDPCQHGNPDPDDRKLTEHPPLIAREG